MELGALDSSVKKLDGPEGGIAHYVGIPRLPYDFVSIDGPDFLRHGYSWSCNVLDLADTLAGDVLIVSDGREHKARRAYAA